MSANLKMIATLIVVLGLVLKIPVVQLQHEVCPQDGSELNFLPVTVDYCVEQCKGYVNDASSELMCNNGELSLQLDIPNFPQKYAIEYVQVRCTSESNTETLFEWCGFHGSTMLNQAVQLNYTQQIQAGTNLPGTQCTVECIRISGNNKLCVPNSRCTIQAFPPQVSSNVTTVKEGKVLNLTCINDNPAGVTQQWLDSNGVAVSNDTSFIVENVTRDYTGEYTCVLYGVNNYTISETVTVTVQYKPQVTTEDSHTKMIHVGDNVSLSCGYDGVPTPTVRWLYNNVELMNDTDENVTITDEDGKSILFLRNIELESAGSYSCVANNSMGEEAFSSFTIEVTPEASTSQTTETLFVGVTTDEESTPNSESEYVIPTATGLLVLVFVTIAVVLLTLLGIKKYLSRKYDRYHSHLHFFFYDEIELSFNEPVKLDSTSRTVSKSMETLIIAPLFPDKNDNINDQDNNDYVPPIAFDLQIQKDRGDKIQPPNPDTASLLDTSHCHNDDTLVKTEAINMEANEEKTINKRPDKIDIKIDVDSSSMNAEHLDDCSIPMTESDSARSINHNDMEVVSHCLSKEKAPVTVTSTQLVSKGRESEKDGTNTGSNTQAGYVSYEEHGITRPIIYKHMESCDSGYTENADSEVTTLSQTSYNDVFEEVESNSSTFNNTSSDNSSASVYVQQQSYEPEDHPVKKLDQFRSTTTSVSSYITTKSSLNKLPPTWSKSPTAEEDEIFPIDEDSDMPDDNSPCSNDPPENQGSSYVILPEQTQLSDSHSTTKLPLTWSKSPITDQGKVFPIDEDDKKLLDNDPCSSDQPVKQMQGSSYIILPDQAPLSDTHSTALEKTSLDEVVHLDFDETDTVFFPESTLPQQFLTGDFTDGGEVADNKSIRFYFPKTSDPNYHQLLHAYDSHLSKVSLTLPELEQMS